MAGVPIIGDVIGFITTPFTAAAGWAWDTVVEGLTDWITKGVLALLTSMWNFMDTASSPKLESEWFYTSASSPFRIAMGIGIAMVSMLVLFALIRAVAAGSPGAVLRTVGHDLPVAIFAMVSLVAVSAAGIDLTDGLSDFIWAQTRDDAMVAMDNLGVTLMTQLPHMHFLGVAVALVLMVAMLFMWVVLFVREALIYLVVIYAVSFGLPAMIFPPLRDTSKKVLELLVALMIAKPVMVLALSVGVSALGGIGSTGQPGDPVGDNLARELGTLVSGAITFGLAAFMPFLVWRLMPIVAAAVGAQGIAFNQARADNMYSFGYPAAAPYDGTKLIYCSGRTFNAFLSNGIGMTCNMTGGASGGPWFRTFSEATGTGLLNSVNSYKISIIPTWMFGPYFGADAQNLYNLAQAA
jgi:hypothetical protein